MTTKEKIYVMQSFLKGALIVKSDPSGKVVAYFSNKTIENPTWDWKNYRYHLYLDGITLPISYTCGIA